jgi:hypothetical protein
MTFRDSPSPVAPSEPEGLPAEQAVRAKTDKKGTASAARRREFMISILD